MNLQEKLVFLRKQKGWTQLDLAENVNVSRQAISRWEVGHAVPSVDNLKFLSDLYGVSVDYLLDDTAEQPHKTAEIQEMPQSVAWWKKIEKKQVCIMLCVFGIVAAVLISVFVAIAMNQDHRKITPIKEFTRETNVISDGTFSFD